MQIFNKLGNFESPELQSIIDSKAINTHNNFLSVSGFVISNIQGR